VGLPPERGGRSKHSGGLPATKIECNAGVKGDKCVFDPSRRILIIEHSKPRQPLFDPKNDPKIPISIRCLGSARTSIMIVKGKVDFIQDNWRKRGEYPIQNEWVGITCFRVYGPYETDLGINICHLVNHTGSRVGPNCETLRGCFCRKCKYPPGRAGSGTLGLRAPYPNLRGSIKALTSLKPELIRCLVSSSFLLDMKRRQAEERRSCKHGEVFVVCGQ